MANYPRCRLCGATGPLDAIEPCCACPGLTKEKTAMHLSSEEMISKVNTTIIEHLGVEASQITREADFADDLGCDSLDMVELTMAFEENFGIEISDEEAERVENVGHAYDLLSAKLTK